MKALKTRTFSLLLLFGINFLNFFDRQILASVTEPLRHEWQLTDTQLGWLVTAFTLLYAAVGLPLGRLADVWRRNLLLATGLALWSGLTFLSGMCRNYWQLFAARLGVGVGEASCAPAASSLIGDLYRPEERSRAMSVFMLGLPTGVALSYVVGGFVAHHYGWRAVFYIAGIPGLMLAAAFPFLKDPPRGQAEMDAVGTRLRSGSPTKLVWGIATMRWIILSGLLHNFIMYAFTFFLPSLLVRYFATSLQTAGWVSALVIGTAGAIGMLAGGWFGDAMRKKRDNGRLLAAGAAMLIAVPAVTIALLLPGNALYLFVIMQGFVMFFMYSYYPAVYATMHDIVEPALRGRAMAIYFFAMYMLGASLGPVVTGRLSDYFARRAEGFQVLEMPRMSPSPEHFRALGLHHAMYIVPVFAILLAAVLFAAAATAPRDIRVLRGWMASNHRMQENTARSTEKC